MAIRFDLYNSSLCFVNSHLAAHVEEVERRNQDYLDICNRLVFSTTFPSKSIKDHDQVFWIGDLNYRLSGDLDLLRVKELLDQNNHLALLQYDQFRAQHAARKIFIGYQEGPIQFRPSYKYDPGTDNWDTSFLSTQWNGHGLDQHEGRRFLRRDWHSQFGRTEQVWI